MVCLDTSFIVDIMRECPEAIQLKDKLEKSSNSLAIASPTIIELIRGLDSLNLRETEKDRIEDFISLVTTLSLDRKSAIKAGNIDSELIKKGEKIDIEDVMIAAIAITNNE
ncbi:MAG TPA: PIN domain-containing protein, partial [Candidatus Nanoarchaeia archaeon]|nr:PIN domain-containing protein [Candidatus Nanoarchaeia archaeon]